MTIKRIAVSALLVSATAVFSIYSYGNTPESAESPLPGTRLAGQGLLRYFGFEVYRARLWVPPGFEADDYAARGWAGLALDEAVTLAAAVFEVNADFFVRQVAPSIAQVGERLAPILSAGTMPSPGSSPPATAMPR